MKRLKKWTALGCLFFFMAGMLFPNGAAALTVKQEEALAREFIKIIKSRCELIQDKFIVDYINGLGRKILAQYPPHPFHYRFYVVKEDVYNAFAVPAGHIFINSGLIAALSSEEQLAGIISHEIAHVYCRHFSSRIKQAKKIQLATMAGLLAGILIGVGGGSPAAAQAVTMGSSAMGQSMSLANSRDDEMQADQMGIEYLNKAGYSAGGLLTALKIIRDKRWYGPEEVPTYLTTHPAAEDRIVTIASWVAQAEKSGGPPSEAHAFPDPESDFDRVRLKLIAQYGDEVIALKKFREIVAEQPDNPMARHGHGLVLARTGQRRAAVRELKTALEKRAFDPQILQDLGRIYFLDGQYERALDTLEGAVSVGGDDPEGVFFLARTRMELGNLLEAETTFETLIGTSPQYTEAYYFLGIVHGELGRLAEAHYSLGIFYRNRGDVRNAIIQFEKALEKAVDSAQREKIESAMNKLKEPLEKKGKKKEESSKD
ncbi:MAG: M48 family metalloprotease [Desulfobacterales bacterium]|nr:M48 family metalloprotease [Desulfobacterales bacterium]